MNQGGFYDSQSTENNQKNFREGSTKMSSVQEDVARDKSGNKNAIEPQGNEEEKKEADNFKTKIQEINKDPLMANHISKPHSRSPERNKENTQKISKIRGTRTSLGKIISLKENKIVPDANNGNELIPAGRSPPPSKRNKPTKIMKFVSENLNKFKTIKEVENFKRQEGGKRMPSMKFKQEKKNLGQILRATWISFNLRKLPSILKPKLLDSVKSLKKAQSKISMIYQLGNAIRKFKSMVKVQDINNINKHQIKLINDWSWYGDINIIDEDLKKPGGRILRKSMQRFYHQVDSLKNSKLILKILLKYFPEVLRNKFREQLAAFIGKVPAFNPKARWKMTWDLFVMLLIFWNFMIISIAISFGVDLQDVFLFKKVESSHYFYYYFLIFCLINMTLDILFTINTSYYEGGALVNDRRKIMRNFCRKGLVLNIITLSPLVLQLFTYHSQLNPGTIKYINCLFFLKYYSLLEIFKILEEFLSLEERSSGFFSFLQLIIKLCFVAHFLGCYWHGVAYFGANPDENNWLSVKNLSVDDFWTERYIYSVYYALTTMTTVGYGDITPQNTKEMIAAMGTMLIGSAMFGYGINSIGKFLKKINYKEDKLKGDIRSLDRIMKHKKIDYELHARARKYLEFVWNEEKINLENEEELISKLSHSIREEILLQSNGKIIKHYPMLYKNFSEKALRKMINFIKPVRFSPEEIIFEENDISYDPFLFLITQGEIELLVDHQNRQAEPCTISVLKEGDAFGEISFFTDLPQKFTARSLKYSTVYMLRKGDFLTIIKEDSEDWEKFCMLRDRITIYKDYNGIKQRCYSCGCPKHLFFQCPGVFYIPSKERTIQKYKYISGYVKNKRRPLQKPREIRKMNALYHNIKIKESSLKFQTVEEVVNTIGSDVEQSLNSNLCAQEESLNPNPHSPLKSAANAVGNKTKPSRERSLLQGTHERSAEPKASGNEEYLLQPEINSRLFESESVRKEEQSPHLLKKFSETQNKSELFMMNFDVFRNLPVYFPYNNPETVILSLSIKRSKTKKNTSFQNIKGKLMKESASRSKITPQDQISNTFIVRNSAPPRKSLIKRNFFKDYQEGEGA